MKVSNEVETSEKYRRAAAYMKEAVVSVISFGRLLCQQVLGRKKQGKEEKQIFMVYKLERN